MRRFFHISPDWCGEARVVQLFRLNRHPSACHEEGRLADDIAWSQAAGRVPLQPWPGARAFTGLHRLDRLDRAPVEGWRSFAQLDRSYPASVFILTTRDVDGWIADRLTRDGGIVARAYAQALQCETMDLPQRWLDDWQAHLAAVESYFRDDPRLVRLDMDHETPADLAAKLSPWIDLPILPARDGWFPAPERGQAAALMRVIEGGGHKLAPKREARAADGFVADIARFCLRGLEPDGERLDGVSPLYGHWDGDAAFLRRDGSRWPIAIGQGIDGQPRAYAAPGTPKLDRLEGVINDILSLGRRDPVHIDMEDNRWFGSPEGAPIGSPVLCHNRRQGARNAVLWPLPGFHTIGLQGFATFETPDRISWDDKADRLVWRGNLSGGVQRAGVLRPVEAAHSVLRRLAEAGDDPVARDSVHADLLAIPRLDILRRYIDNPRMDLGLVMSHAYRSFEGDPFIAPYARPRLSQAQMHGFRYQLSLTGYDHPTNVIGALNSHAVLLKEEDGWEVYYSGRFRPWEHYIPIQRFAPDLAEKLDWARAHPDRCQAMSQAARAEVALLADRDLQRQIMARVLDGIRAAV